MITLVATEVLYLSQGDEDAFFDWLKSIPCVSAVEGIGQDLMIRIKDANIGDPDLRELIAIFCRYRIDGKQLKQFVTTTNAGWFKDNETSYWHEKVFRS